MFTGIIKGVATVLSINKKSSKYYKCYFFMPNFFLKGIHIGDSISNNGCCLTIIKIFKNIAKFHIINETYKKTNLKFLKKNDLVNVERAARFNDEIGGHIVSGHIITTAKIIKIFKSKKYLKFLLKLNNKFIKYIFYKGFICLDGVSLTVGKIVKNCFYVRIIPETFLRTNFMFRKVNDFINIEIDSMTQIIVDTCKSFFKKKHNFLNFHN
ncbi:Riboflavin synthase [Buchnera aphidicola (Periphyllus testudinaceus)]|uniref:riboflavin synthase subunit alpha n=1 Tax=Buchnera aphidicola TaxID=9 RepID=UPI0034645BF2